MTGEQNIKRIGALKVADELEALQVSKNQKRGVSCVRDMIFYLRLGKIQTAINIRQLEGDKTRSYPDIEKYLNKVFGCRLHSVINCKKEWCQ